ncbi:MAG: PIG-L family deacetylase [Janthinobacterium lividum]
MNEIDVKSACTALILLAAAAVPLAAQRTASSPAPLQPPVPAYATPLPFDRGAAGLAQSLRKLATRASLIQINAHPDDEDGGMLAYESRGVGAEVSLLSLNRGEGGQNIMTGEFWDGLGILRTEEHLAANHYYGVHLYYTRVADFGFSKTREETLKQWTHERVLGDAVRVVRETHPMVVTSVFSGNVSDGHGHHQTAGVLAQEVFNAAADPKMFPDQIREGLRPWAPLKVYARTPFARVTKEGIFDYATGKVEPLLYKNYVTGAEMHEVPAVTVTVPSGQYNALFGESYAQISREGLNQQKSQTGGVPTPPPGRADATYHLYASRVQTGTLPEHESGFFQGIDTSLAGIAGYLPTAAQAEAKAKLQVITAMVKEAIDRFDANDPAKSAAALARGLDDTRALISSLQANKKLSDDDRYDALFELRIKERQFNEALAQSLGMSMVATVQNGPTQPQRGPGQPGGNDITSQTAVAGETFGVGIHVADQGTEPVTVDGILLQPSALGGDWKVRSAPPAPAPAQSAAAIPPDAAAVAGAPKVTATEQPPVRTEAPKPFESGPLAAGVAVDDYLLATVPANAAPTMPYYSRPSLEQSYYDIHDPRWLTLPEEPYPLSAEVRYTFNGTHAMLEGVVQTPHRYNGLGTLSEPLRIAPAISVQVEPASGVLPLTATALSLQVTVHSSIKGQAQGTLKLDLPRGWTAEPATATFQTRRDNEDVVLRFRVMTPGLQTKTYRITAVADVAGKQYSNGFVTIGYPGVRPYPRFSPAVSSVTGIDVKLDPSVRVGYVMGSGDDVPDALRQMGVNATLLSDADLRSGDLRSYNYIVLGVRTYTARPVLRAVNGRLLDYVRAGGVVITQYQSAEFDHDYGPYPLSVPGDQGHTVVEEDAKVTLLKPNDPVLNWPNRIGVADFEGWVEERGHGFPKSFDPKYIAPTSVHDTGQDPQTGGLIYTQYGRGYYVYLAYAFFREMPEGVPGSFRIMANLLSMDKNPGLSH